MISWGGKIIIVVISSVFRDPISGRPPIEMTYQQLFITLLREEGVIKNGYGGYEEKE